MSERVALTLRLDVEDHEVLRRLSFGYRLPISEVIRRAVHAMVSSAEEQAFLLAPDRDGSKE